MLKWLDERPDLPLPVQGAWAMSPTGGSYGEDGDAFHVFVSSQGEVDSLANQFDEFEEAPQYPFNPSGVRRVFRSVAYEILLGWQPSLAADDLQPVRSGRIAGLLEMVAFLAKRPDLPLPLHAAWVTSLEPDPKDDLIFTVWAASEGERDRLAGQFDRVDRRADLPLYVNRPSRLFSAGVRYEVEVGD
jgi:hypothetical protein